MWIKVKLRHPKLIRAPTCLPPLWRRPSNQRIEFDIQNESSGTVLTQRPINLILSLLGPESSRLCMLGSSSRIDVLHSVSVGNGLCTMPSRFPLSSESIEIIPVHPSIISTSPSVPRLADCREREVELVEEIVFLARRIAGVIPAHTRLFQ